MTYGKLGADPYITIWGSSPEAVASECSRAIDLGYKPAGGSWTSVVNGNTNWIYQSMWREPSKEETDGRHL